MADDPTQSQRTAGDESHEDDERDAQQSPKPSGEAQRDAGQSTDDHSGDDDPVKLKALVDKLRPHEREAARLKRELDAANAKLREREDAEKSDLQKAIEERDALKAEKADWAKQRQTLNLRHQTADAAREAGFADPADVYRFLDLDELEFDDDDQPLGIADQVKALAKAKPYLLAPKNGAASGPPATEKSSRPGGQVSPEEDKQRRQEFERNFAQSW